MTDFEPVSNRKKELTINKCLQSFWNINKYCLVFSYVNSLLDTLEISHGGVSGDLANLFGQRGAGRLEPAFGQEEEQSCLRNLFTKYLVCARDCIYSHSEDTTWNDFSNMYGCRWYPLL